MTSRDDLEDSKQDLEYYEKKLVIERHDLDSELVSEPGLFNKVSECLAFAISYRDEAKKESKRVGAEADARIRSKLFQQMEKVTEGVVAREITLDQRVKESEDLIIQWDLLVNRWSGLKESFEHRHYNLGKLADMYVKGYTMGSSAGDTRPSSRSEVLDRSAREVRSDQKRQRAKLVDGD